MLDRFVRGCKPSIRLELKQAYSKKKDKGECLDLMEATKLVETEDCYSVQRSQGFHPKKRRFGKKYLAALSKGNKDGGASSSKG